MRFKFYLVILTSLFLVGCSNMLGDIISPVIGGDGELTIVDTSYDDGTESISISWDAAEDESHSTENLTYILYFTEVDPEGDLDLMISTGTVLDTLPSGTTSYSTEKTEDGITGFVTAVVSDPVGNMSIYSTRPYSTNPNITNTLDENGNLIPVLDSVGPVPGGSSDSGVTSEILATDITSNSVLLSWDLAEDDLTENSNLEYYVVLSTSDNISTLLDAQNNGVAQNEWTLNLSSLEITDLEPYTTYWYNVLVKDSSGNVTIYTQGQTTTPSIEGTSELGITIEIDGIIDIVLTFKDENNDAYTSIPSVLSTDDIEINIAGSYDEIIGIYLDNISVEDKTGITLSGDNKLTINPNNAGLSSSLHSVLIIVKKDNKTYSCTFKFRVTED